MMESIQSLWFGRPWIRAVIGLWRELDRSGKPVRLWSENECLFNYRGVSEDKNAQWRKTKVFRLQ